LFFLIDAYGESKFDVTCARPGRQHGFGKQQPSFFNVRLTSRLSDDRDAPHVVGKVLRPTAEVEAGRPIFDGPLDLVDLAKEQERASTEAPQAPHDFDTIQGGPQWNDDDRFVAIPQTR
jgi:hypothetical protein